MMKRAVVKPKIVINPAPPGMHIPPYGMMKNVPVRASINNLNKELK